MISKKSNLWSINRKDALILNWTQKLPTTIRSKVMCHLSLKIEILRPMGWKSAKNIDGHKRPFPEALIIESFQKYFFEKVRF